MQFTDLTPEQRRRIRVVVERHLGYYGKLTSRFLKMRGEDDGFREYVLRVQQELHRLCAEVRAPTRVQDRASTGSQPDWSQDGQNVP